MVHSSHEWYIGAMNGTQQPRMVHRSLGYIEAHRRFNNHGMYETESYRPSLENGEQVEEKRFCCCNPNSRVIYSRSWPYIHSAMGLGLQIIVESKPHREIDFYHQKLIPLNSSLVYKSSYEVILVSCHQMKSPLFCTSIFH